MPLLLQGLAPELLKPPVNVLRVALHPNGLAARTANLAEWRGHLLERLRREIGQTADSGLIELMAELKAYPVPPAPDRRPQDFGGIAVPFQLLTDAGVLSFFSTTTVFGTPVDITLSELALETFLPADAATAEFMRIALRSLPQA